MKAPVRVIKILVIEDECLIALDIADQLTSLGYSVCAIVRTADEAVERAGAMRPDLILTDINLAQGSSGLDAARRIRSDFGIPCCFLSGSVDDALIAEARECAPLGILTKPFQPRLLRGVLAEAFAANAA